MSLWIEQLNEYVIGAYMQGNLHRIYNCHSQGTVQYDIWKKNVGVNFIEFGSTKKGLVLRRRTKRPYS
jgi:hypothetical protein